MKDEDVEIVKMDASNNDVVGPYEVQGFPTLFWATKDSKSKPVKYEVSSKYKKRVKEVFTIIHHTLLFSNLNFVKMFPNNNR